MAEDENVLSDQEYIESVATDICQKTLKVKQFLLQYIKKEGVKLDRKEISERDILTLFGTLSMNDVLVEEVNYVEKRNGFELKIPEVMSKDTSAIGMLSGSNCEKDEIFVSCKPNQIELLNFSGRVLWRLCMEFAPQAFSLTSDGYLLMSHFKMMEICYARKSETAVKSYISTTPLFPLGLYCETNGTTLVCLVERFSFTTTKGSRRLVRRYSSQGTALRDIEFADNRSPLFCCPYRVVGLLDTCNRVHVLDVIGKNRGKITTTKDTGEVLYEFKADGEVFSPIDLCVDKFCNVYIADAHSNSIFVLDPQGAIATTLSSFESSKLSSAACLYGHLIGVGFDDGKLQIYEWTDRKLMSDDKKVKNISSFEIEK